MKVMRRRWETHQTHPKSKKPKSKTHHYKPIKKDPVVGGSDGMAADGKSMIAEVMVRVNSSLTL